MKKLITLTFFLVLLTTYCCVGQISATDKNFGDRFEQDTGETLYRIKYPKGYKSLPDTPITLYIIAEADNATGYLMFEENGLTNPKAPISDTNYPTSVAATKARVSAGEKLILTGWTTRYVENGASNVVVYLRVEASADNQFFTITY